MDVIYSLREIPLGFWSMAGLIVLVCALVAYDTVGGVRSHAAFLSMLRAAPADEAEAVRARFLHRWAWQPWIFTLAALLLVVLSPTLDLADVGLRLPTLPSVGEEGWSVLVGAAVGIAIVAVAAAVIVWRRRRTPGERVAPTATPHVNAQVDPMLPTGPRDRRAWLLLSATAGITEEIMYRGVLLLALSTLLSVLEPMLICVIAVLVFAAAHAYQGWAGMIVTGLVAIPLLALYLLTGSLLPGMVLHFAMDARAVFIKSSKPAP